MKTNTEIEKKWLKSKYALKCSTELSKCQVGMNLGVLNVIKVYDYVQQYNKRHLSIIRYSLIHICSSAYLL